MSHTLLLHDKLTPPQKPEAYLEILDLQVRDGCIKVFDAERREERYVELTTIYADIQASKLTLQREGAPRFNLAEQADDAALYEQTRFIREVMRCIKDIRKRRGSEFSGGVSLVVRGLRSGPDAAAQAPASPVDNVQLP